MPQKAIAATHDSSGKINHTLTGSGPETWYHNGTFAGISDLNGNVWDWCGGLRLVNGEIQLLANNDAADQNNSLSSSSTLWKAIMPDGTLVVPGNGGTLKYNTNVSGIPFGTISTVPSAESAGALLLEVLGLTPHSNSVPADYGNAGVWVSKTDERLMLHGGCWKQKNSTGVFAFALDTPRTSYNDIIGFRCAYCGPVHITS